MIPGLDQRPVIVALAGPNGAGKSTFYGAHLQATGLRLVNADILSRDLGIDAYPAAEIAEVLRKTLVAQRVSFVFETVFSDPVSAKVTFLQEAAQAGYNVIVCFIGLPDPEVSEQRVAMRVSQGGHDVPTDKLVSRFPRTVENLKKSIRVLPRVLVFDNGNLAHPFRRVAVFEKGKAVYVAKSMPGWMDGIA